MPLLTNIFISCPSILATIITFHTNFQINMKRIIGLGLVLLGLAACNTTAKLSPQEEAKFAMRGFEVLYEGKPVAKYDNKEYEYSNGKFIFEYSIIQYDPSNMELTEKMARYLAKKNPGAKIEIKLQQDLPKLDPEEAAKFETKGFDIYYEGKMVAQYENKEYEYNNGVFQFEYSVTQLDAGNAELTDKLAKYLASRNERAKIEIKLAHD